MEFEVSSGFAPHQHSAMKENQQVRVIRGWEGLVPPVTLPLQPRSPPPPTPWEEGSPPLSPCLSLPGGLSPVLQRGAGRGLRSLWWVPGTGTAGMATPISATRARCPSSCSGPFCPGAFPFPAGIPQIPFAPPPAGEGGRLHEGRFVSPCRATMCSQEPRACLTAPIRFSVTLPKGSFFAVRAPP